MKYSFTLLLCLGSSITMLAQKHLGGKMLGSEATVYENRDFVKREFLKVIVRTGTQDAKADKKIISEYKNLNIALVSWLDFFPPVKDYSEDEIKKTCIEKSVDGIIAIDIKANQKTGMYASKESNMELSFTDLKTGVKAITFIGRASLSAYSTAFAPDKTILKFVRLTYNDLERTIKP